MPLFLSPSLSVFTIDLIFPPPLQAPPADRKLTVVLLLSCIPTQKFDRTKGFQPAICLKTLMRGKLRGEDEGIDRRREATRQAGRERERDKERERNAQKKSLNDTLSDQCSEKKKIMATLW